MPWATLDAVRGWTRQRRLSLRGLVGATVETVTSCVPAVSLVSKLLGEIAACGVDRLAGAEAVPDVKPAGAPLSADQLDQINAWLECITTRYAELLDRLEQRLPEVPDCASAEELTALVRRCVEDDGELTRRFDEHLVESRRQTLSLGLIERQLDDFAHGQRQIWASLEEIKDLFVGMPGAGEMDELRRVRPEALRAVHEADDHFLAGRRDEGVQALFSLLKARGVGEATLARHVGPRLCGMVELTPAVRAKLRLDADSPAGRTMAAVTTWSARGAGLRVWRSLPRGLVIERKYRIEEEVGRGGMASVYRAVGVSMLTRNKVYAIKVPAAELLDEPETAERFIREVEIAETFSSRAYHGNIIQTLGHVVFDDPHESGRERVGLVLEYIEGQSLARLLEARKLAGRPLAPDEIHHVLDAVCQALEHAHGQGVLHRDAKPHNVLLAGGPDQPVPARAVKLMDFGIARVLDEGLDDLTRTGTALGTRGYMPPEFTCDPPRASERSDVYLLGVLLREMLTFHPHGDLEGRLDCPIAWLRLIDEATRPVERFRPPTVAVARRRLADGLREWQVLRDGSEAELRHERAQAHFDRHEYAAAAAELDRVPVENRDARLYAQATTLRDRLAALEAEVQTRGGLGRFDVFSAALIEEMMALCPDLGEFSGALATARRKLPKQVANSLGMRFALVPPGTFLMGSPDSEEGRGGDEGPQHEVEISRPFWIGLFPVTVGQFHEFVTATNYRTEAERSHGAYGWTGSEWKQEFRFNWTSPGFTQTDDHPVTCVSWNDVGAFLEWLNGLKEERGASRLYRLPTEAEWEYACRGGMASHQSFHYGNILTSNLANFDGNYPYGGAKGEFRQQTTPLGTFMPNDYGLHDMHGNVWEWCADWYAPDFYKCSPRIDPQGPASGSLRVRRGGSWYDDGCSCRSVQRNKRMQDNRRSDVGFRVIVVPSDQNG